MLLTEFKNLKQLINYFSTEEICRDYLEEHRWGGIPTCPHCTSDKWYKLRNTKLYRCGTCKKKYSVTVGTVMESTKIPLSTWFMAIYIISAHKTGISSVQLGKDVGIKQSSAWFLLHRIREMFQEKTFTKLTGVIELDELYVGQKDRKNRTKKMKPGRGSVNKIPVLGILQRGGNIVYQVVPDTSADVLRPIISARVDKAAIINTDGHLSYTGLDKEFAAHEVVNHGAGEYVRGIYHTNGVEGAFGQLRRGIRGIYIKMSKKHLQRYCHEFSYRFNTREMKDADRFVSLLDRLPGRLRYQDLIK